VNGEGRLEAGSQRVDGASRNLPINRRYFLIAFFINIRFFSALIPGAYFAYAKLLLCRLRHTFYSALSALRGSIRAKRHAGTQHASMTATKNEAGPANVSGSTGEILTSSPCIGFRVVTPQ
jgi:hypothetical protein